jgi:ABC-2 type transport system permease protein
MLGGAFTNSVFGLLRASVVAASITASGGAIQGYALASGVTYVWITQALIAPLQIFIWDHLALRIRTGDIAVDLARPIDLQAQFAAEDIGRAAAIALPRALPPLVVGALTFGLVLPTRPVTYLAGAVSALLALGISFACRYLVNLSAVWLLDVRGVLTVYVTVSTVLAGLVIPVRWFPGWLSAVAAATPFPSMLQTPAEILAGLTRPDAVPGVLLTQLTWLAVVVVLGRAAQAVAMRRLVVQGG